MREMCAVWMSRTEQALHYQRSEFELEAENWSLTARTQMNAETEMLRRQLYDAENAVAERAVEAHEGMRYTLEGK